MKEIFFETPTNSSPSVTDCVERVKSSSVD